MTLVKLNNRPAKTINSFLDEILHDFPATWNKESFATPQVNISETADAYVMDLNVPGRKKEDFKLNIENGLFTISYEKQEESKQEDVKSIRREFNYSSFKRSFNLDEKIDTENIQAKYENGILNIVLAKREEVKPVVKQITVK